MKKFIALGILVLFGSSNLFVSQGFACEVKEYCNKNSENFSKSEPRALTVRYWFKTIPPKTYKNRTRIDYYKTDNGYTGVYF